MVVMTLDSCMGCGKLLSQLNNCQTGELHRSFKIWKEPLNKIIENQTRETLYLRDKAYNRNVYINFFFSKQFLFNYYGNEGILIFDHRGTPGEIAIFYLKYISHKVGSG